MRNWFYLGGRLLAITLLAGLALALTYHVTYPIKQARQAEALEAALVAVYPGAQTEEIDLSAYEEDARLEGITAAYRATADTNGYIFITSAKGYKSTIELTVGIKEDGTITGVVVNSHDESPGIGDRILGEEFRNQFVDKTAPVEFGTDGVDSLSGATYSSRGVRDAINRASAALELLGEAK